MNNRLFTLKEMQEAFNHYRYNPFPHGQSGEGDVFNDFINSLPATELLTTEKEYWQKAGAEVKVFAPESAVDIFKRYFVKGCMERDGDSEEEAIEQFNTNMRDNEDVAGVVFAAMEEYANQFKATPETAADAPSAEKTFLVTKQDVIKAINVFLERRNIHSTKFSCDINKDDDIEFAIKAVAPFTLTPIR